MAAVEMNACDAEGVTSVSGRRVLLVEDNKINQQYAMLILNKAGYRVEVAGDGREGVDKVVAGDFDIVLMDIQMPVLDGVCATREIRTLAAPKNAVPILGVSAHALAKSRDQALGAGMNDYICKPFQPRALLQAVAKLMGGAGATPVPVLLAAEVPEGEPGKMPVLDTAQLRLFESVFSAAKLRTLASLYIIDVDARMTLIGECRSRDDFDGLARQAHMIVSTAGNLGAKLASACARILEEACIQRETAGCDAQIADLDHACRQSVEAIKAWLERSVEQRQQRDVA
jgi:CheY-like chemotaxis protein/HPt (histidine-containing phosphotransfer) domain-containing protein